MKIITIVLFCLLVVLKTPTVESVNVPGFNYTGKYESLNKSVYPGDKDISIRQCGSQLSKTIASICRMRLSNYWAIVEGNNKRTIICK